MNDVLYGRDSMSPKDEAGEIVNGRRWVRLTSAAQYRKVFEDSFREALARQAVQVNHLGSAASSADRLPASDEVNQPARNQAAGASGAETLAPAPAALNSMPFTQEADPSAQTVSAVQNSATLDADALLRQIEAIHDSSINN